jgi:hypothetical protein
VKRDHGFPLPSRLQSLSVQGSRDPSGKRRHPLPKPVTVVHHCGVVQQVDVVAYLHRHMSAAASYISQAQAQITTSMFDV